jgi:hypothetical protein
MNSTSPSLELGEDRRQVAGPLERRAGRDVQVHPHLRGDDAGQRRLPSPGGPANSRWSTACPAAGRFEHDAQVLLQLALADELVERSRSQPRLDFDLRRDGVVGSADPRVEELVTHAGLPAT